MCVVVGHASRRGFVVRPTRKVGEGEELAKPPLPASDHLDQERSRARIGSAKTARKIDPGFQGSMRRGEPE